MDSLQRRETRDRLSEIIRQITGERVSAAVARRKISMNSAAKSCRVSVTYMCSLAAGKQVPTLEVLVKLSIGLKVSMSYLTRGLPECFEVLDTGK